MIAEIDQSFEENERYLLRPSPYSSDARGARHAVVPTRARPLNDLDLQVEYFKVRSKIEQ